VVEAVIAGLRPTANAKGVRLESHLDGAAGPIRADPTRLQQIVSLRQSLEALKIELARTPHYFDPVPGGGMAGQ
jgi:hypothetical protein